MSSVVDIIKEVALDVLLLVSTWSIISLPAAVEVKNAKVRDLAAQKAASCQPKDH